jgi:hypothetical protein
VHATSWTPDPELPLLSLSWEAAWLPKSAEGVADWSQDLLIDTAALGHALHAAIRPAALLPLEAAPQYPFVVALRRIEVESTRLMQAQIRALSCWQSAMPSTRPSNVVTRRCDDVPTCRSWRSRLMQINTSFPRSWAF